MVGLAQEGKRKHTVFLFNVANDDFHVGAVIHLETQHLSGEAQLTGSAVFLIAQHQVCLAHLIAEIDRAKQQVVVAAQATVGQAVGEGQLQVLDLVGSLDQSVIVGVLEENRLVAEHALQFVVAEMKADIFLRTIKHCRQLVVAFLDAHVAHGTADAL